MPLRKLLLKVVLWSLGLTAVVGVMMALFSTGDVMWRLVATGLMTAVAAGLMTAGSLLMDKPKARLAGLLLIYLSLAEFILGLTLLWDEALWVRGWGFEEQIAATMLFVGLVGLGAAIAALVLTRPLTRVAGAFTLALSAVVLILLLAAVWTGNFWHNDALFETAGALAGFGALAAANLVGVGQKPARPWRYAGVLAAALGLCISVYASWTHIPSYPEGEALFGTLIAISAWSALAILALAVPLTPGQLWVRIVTIAAAAITAVLLDSVLWIGESTADQFGIFRYAAAAAIVTGCGVLALLVLARLNRHMGEKPVLAEIRELTVICPGCRKKQLLSLDPSPARCRTCGLKFHIKIEEPHCPRCDYLLYMLQSDRCPECGHPVADPAASAGPAAAPAPARQPTPTEPVA